jgi:hemoglobin/transferrin/lactoferrin receptor protein
MMNKFLTLLCILSFSTVFAQEIMVKDELGSPIREAHIISLEQNTHAFTNKYGIADLSSFSTNEPLQISHSSFISVFTNKFKLQSQNNQLILVFDSETLGEIILLTRIDDENLKTTADRRVILHQKEIERLNTQTTADLLEKKAGVNVQKSQMGGGSPVIRGFEANRVLLVIDGVRLNNAIYRGGHLQSIISVDNATLEQVEIIFGPSSSEYSSDGLGGVIHLHTKRPKFTASPNFTQNYSTRFATANSGMSKHYDLSYTSKDFAVFSSFTNSDFDDLRMGKVRNHGYENWGKVYHYMDNDKQKENPNPNIQKNTGYSQKDFMQKAILRLSDKLLFTGNFQFSNSSNIPRFDKLNDYKLQQLGDTIYEDLKYKVWNYGPQKRSFYSMQFDYSADNFFMDSAQLILAYQDVFETRFVQKSDSDERLDQHENVDIFSLNVNFRKKELHYGFEYYNNKVLSKAFKTTNNISAPHDQTRYPNGGSSMSSWAGYITYHKKISEQIKLNAGIRFTENKLNGKYIPEGRFPTITLPYDSIDNKYNAFTGNFSVAYFPNESWKIAAIVSSGFHAPNLDDVSKVFYKGSNVTIPNFNLRPEYANTAEINITKNINNRVLINANAYYTAISDAIMRVEAGSVADGVEFSENEEGFDSIKTNKNTGKAEIYGATTSVSMRIASNYTLETDYTYIKGRNKDTDLPFTHIPPSFGKTALYADFDQWRASFYALYNGRKSIDEYDLISGTDNEEESPMEWVYLEESDSWHEEFQGTPAWYTLNMSFMYRFTENFTLQLAAENILDHHYKTFASGLSAPGRNFILTLRAKL